MRRTSHGLAPLLLAAALVVAASPRPAAAATITVTADLDAVAVDGHIGAFEVGADPLFDDLIFADGFELGHVLRWPEAVE